MKEVSNTVDWVFLNSGADLVLACVLHHAYTGCEVLPLTKIHHVDSGLLWPSEDTWSGSQSREETCKLHLSSQEGCKPTLCYERAQRGCPAAKRRE